MQTLCRLCMQVCRIMLAWQQRSKEAVLWTGTPGSSSFLENQHVLPSRSRPRLLSGNSFFHHLETAQVWTRSPRHPCSKDTGQRWQHRLSRGLPDLRPQGKEASVGPLVHSSLLRTHTLPCLSPRGSVGRPPGSHRARAHGQRVGSWSEGHRSLHPCDCVTSLKPVRTLMMICELKLVWC